MRHELDKGTNSVMPAVRDLQGHGLLCGLSLPVDNASAALQQQLQEATVGVAARTPPLDLCADSVGWQISVALVVMAARSIQTVLVVKTLMTIDWRE
ncbi:unnamed protein product [Urochloa humidicola]